MPHCATIKRCLTHLAMLAGLAACSNQGTYTGLQQSEIYDCQTEPPGAYEACIERNSMPYTEYERERAQILEQEAEESEAEDFPDETLAAPELE